LYTQSEPEVLRDIVDKASFKSRELPDDIYQYQSVRNPDNSLTLHFRVFPIQYDEVTKVVTFNEDIDITIEYSPMSSAQLPFFWVEETEVVQDSTIELLWAVENRLDTSQALTANFFITDPAGNAITQFADKAMLEGKDANLFKTTWNAIVAPNSYIISVDLVDQEGAKVDSKSTNLAVVTSIDTSGGGGALTVVWVILAIVGAVALVVILRRMQSNQRS
jgi:hypothetical protein